MIIKNCYSLQPNYNNDICYIRLYGSNDVRREARYLHEQTAHSEPSMSV